MRWPWQRSTKRDIRDVMERLAQCGFADGVDGATWAGDVTAAVTHGSPWAATLAHRIIFLDAEDLAEGGAQAILATLAPLLAQRGIILLLITEEFSDHGYTLIVEGQRVVLWDETTAATSWETAVYALIGLIDQVLARANVAERLYLIGGGHDGQAILLTPDQAHLLITSRIMPPSERPWHPTTGYPV